MGRKYNKWTQEKYEEFVVVWQNAFNVSEVAAHFGISKQTTLNTACNLRKKGVPLKKQWGSKQRIDYDRLTELAKVELGS